MAAFHGRFCLISTIFGKSHNSIDCLFMALPFDFGFGRKCPAVICLSIWEEEEEWHPPLKLLQAAVPIAWCSTVAHANIFRANAMLATVSTIFGARVLCMTRAGFL
jgi:hypothetical protein